MIISHQHKFIFIKTRKTAGTSIEIALSSICGANDIITPITAIDEQERIKLGFSSSQNFRLPLNRYKVKDLVKLILKGNTLSFYNHMSAQEIFKYVGKDIWNTYYKFCFERNPFDKTISLFHWLNETTNKRYDSLSEFISQGNLGVIKGFDLYAINNLVAVDDVFKYEELSTALEVISNKLQLDQPLGLPSYKAKSNTRKDKRAYKEIISKKDRQLIEIAFAREIKLLDYKY